MNIRPGERVRHKFAPKFSEGNPIGVVLSVTTELFVGGSRTWANVRWIHADGRASVDPTQHDEFELEEVE